MHLHTNLALASLFAICAGACTGASAKDVPSSGEAPRVARAVPHERTAERGTRVNAVLHNAISSRTNRSGQQLRATVSRDVTDTQGRVVIPAGAIVVLTIAHLRPADDAHGDSGELSLSVTKVAVDAKEYGAIADVEPVPYRLTARTIPIDGDSGPIDGDGDAVKDVVAPARTPIAFTLVRPLTVKR
jgi:hypothetical protein